MNYYHLFIYLFARGAKKVSEDQNDLFDRVFWSVNTIAFFEFIPILSIFEKLFAFELTTAQTVIAWIVCCILNYIYLKQGNRFGRILEEYGKKKIELLPSGIM
jgi:hypothetical protein